MDSNSSPSLRKVMLMMILLIGPARGFPVTKHEERKTESPGSSQAPKTPFDIQHYSEYLHHLKCPEVKIRHYHKSIKIEEVETGSIYLGHHPHYGHTPLHDYLFHLEHHHEYPPRPKHHPQEYPLPHETSAIGPIPKAPRFPSTTRKPLLVPLKPVLPIDDSPPSITSTEVPRTAEPSSPSTEVPPETTEPLASTTPKRPRDIQFETRKEPRSALPIGTGGLGEQVELRNSKKQTTLPNTDGVSVTVTLSRPRRQDNDFQPADFGILDTSAEQLPVSAQPLLQTSEQPALQLTAQQPASSTLSEQSSSPPASAQTKRRRQVDWLGSAKKDGSEEGGEKIAEMRDESFFYPHVFDHPYHAPHPRDFHHPYDFPLDGPFNYPHEMTKGMSGEKEGNERTVGMGRESGEMGGEISGTNQVPNQKLPQPEEKLPAPVEEVPTEDEASPLPQLQPRRGRREAYGDEYHHNDEDGPEHYDFYHPHDFHHPYDLSHPYDFPHPHDGHHYPHDHDSHHPQDHDYHRSQEHEEHDSRHPEKHHPQDSESHHPQERDTPKNVQGLSSESHHPQERDTPKNVQGLEHKTPEHHEEHSKCTAPLSAGWTHYNWYQILIENGGAPGGYLKGGLKAELVKVEDPCVRPVKPLHTGYKKDFTYKFVKVGKVFRVESVSLRLAGTPHQFLDFEGQLIWAPPNMTDRYYHLTYRKDDTGLYARLLTDIRCDFKETQNRHTDSYDVRLGCVYHPEKICDCDEHGREVCHKVSRNEHDEYHHDSHEKHDDHAKDHNNHANQHDDHRKPDDYHHNEKHDVHDDHEEHHDVPVDHEKHHDVNYHGKHDVHDDNEKHYDVRDYHDQEDQDIHNNHGKQVPNDHGKHDVHYDHDKDHDSHDERHDDHRIVVSLNRPKGCGSYGGSRCS